MFSGAPYSGAPYSGLLRQSGGRTATATISGGGALAGGLARGLVASVSLAGGGALAAGLARQLVAGAAVAAGGTLAAGLTRQLVTSAALAGGGAIFGEAIRVVARADSTRRTRGGGGDDRGRAAGGIRLRFPTFDSAAERTREGG